MNAIRRQRKAVQPCEFKLDTNTEGAFRAIFSTFNVIDLDQDVTVPGAFETGQKVRIAQWGHQWGEPVIGIGVIGQDDTQAWVDGQFNLAMQAGRETYESVKFAGDLQEWSYGYDILKWSFGQFEGQEVRFLEGLLTHEVSPVMLGAGINTRTDSIKSLLTPEGITLDAHAALVLAANRGLADRLRSHADLRAKEGRVLSEANRSRIREHADAAEAIRDGLRGLYEATAPEPKGHSMGAGRRLHLDAVLSELEGLGITVTGQTPA